MSYEGPLRVREEVLSDGLSTVVGVLKFRVSEVVAEGDTLVAIDDDDVVLVEDEIVDKHWLSQYVFRGSRRSPGGVPLALDSDWMLISDDQTSRERSEVFSSKGASNTSYSCSFSTRCDDLITRSNVLRVCSSLEAGL